MTELAGIIATEKWGNEPFTVKDVYSQSDRKKFADKLIAGHPNAKKASKPWIVSADVKAATPTKAATKSTAKLTPSTDDQQNLIAKKFKLELPNGKINDVFVELKSLDINTKRHAVSVLFRVFLDMSLDSYIERFKIVLPTDGNGKKIDKMSMRIKNVVAHVKASKLMTDKELQPINASISNPAHVLSPETLNAYVHSKAMNPDPLQLKIMWLNVQPFIECLWTAK